MPRGDGTGPFGTGPIGRGRMNNQNMGIRRQGNMCGFAGPQSTNQASLEDQAARLEEQAANLRKRAQQHSNGQ